ncbi:hypothetical protein Bbelb_335820 [Branchiostoma belcheri]|nr:hypothetical protein Bbelb_335820 [Branchiostoma belcheri]
MAVQVEKRNAENPAKSSCGRGIAARTTYLLLTRDSEPGVILEAILPENTTRDAKLTGFDAQILVIRCVLAARGVILPERCSRLYALYVLPPGGTDKKRGIYRKVTIFYTGVCLEISGWRGRDCAAPLHVPTRAARRNLDLMKSELPYVTGRTSEGSGTVDDEGKRFVGSCGSEPSGPEF